MKNTNSAKLSKYQHQLSAISTGSKGFCSGHKDQPASSNTRVNPVNQHLKAKNLITQCFVEASHKIKDMDLVPAEIKGSHPVSVDRQTGKHVIGDPLLMSVGIDTLTAVIHLDEDVEVCEVVEETEGILQAFIPSLEFEPYNEHLRMNHFSTVDKATSGLTVQYSGLSQTVKRVQTKNGIVEIDFSAPQRNEFVINFTGESLRDVSPETLQLLLYKIGDIQGVKNLTSSRIDSCIDDRSGVITPELLNEWSDQDYLCSYQCYDIQTSSKVRSKQKGSTYYAGSSQSKKRVRVYDKRIETLNKILKDNKDLLESDFDLSLPWVRIEVQLRGDNANTLFDAFMNIDFSNESKGLQQFINLTMYNLDYRKPAKDSKQSHRDRPRIPLWSEWLHRLNLTPTRYKVNRKPRNQSINVPEFRAQYSAWMSKFSLIYGIEALTSLVVSMTGEGTRKMVKRGVLDPGSLSKDELFVAYRYTDSCQSYCMA